MLDKVNKKKENQKKFFDSERIEKALNTNFKTAPKGMTKEQKRKFMSGFI